MRVHIDKGRPDMTGSEINCWRTGACRSACRLDCRDPVIVDEKVDKCRSVAIKSCPRPVGQEAGRNAGLSDPITLCFWHLERLEWVHSARWSLARDPLTSYNCCATMDRSTNDCDQRLADESEPPVLSSHL